MSITWAFRVFFLVALTVHLGSGLKSLQTQAPENSSRIGVNVSDGIRFYQIDSVGVAILLSDLSDDFAFYGQGEADWIILAPEVIQVSPHGERVAFVAFRSFPGRTYEEAALFWFDVAQPTLNQVVVPGAFGVDWSPDSSRILLSGIGLGIYFAAISDVLNNSNAYLFTLATESLVQLPNHANERRSDYQWLDSQRLIFRQSGENCDQPCVRAVNLYVLDLTTQTISRLTDIGYRLPLDISLDYLQFYSDCYPELLAWSETLVRLYYSATCYDTSDQAHSYLYSTDLTGNNRLEANLLPFYPDDLYTRIVSIHNVENTVYFTVKSETRPRSEGSEAIFTSWLVFALDNNNIQ